MNLSWKTSLAALIVGVTAAVRATKPEWSYYCDMVIQIATVLGLLAARDNHGPSVAVLPGERGEAPKMLPIIEKPDAN